MIDNPCGYFGKGVADLAGESTAVQFFEKLGGIGCGGHGHFSGRAFSPLGGIDN